MERDASRRMLQWLRELRDKYDIDLLQDLQVPSYATFENRRHPTKQKLDDNELMVTTITEQMCHNSLNSYSADAESLNKTYKNTTPTIRAAA
jgi:hypothetical protein